MRTHRLEVLVSRSEKERIEREAAELGISASEYVREAAALLDAEDIIAARDIPSLLPEFNAALDRIHANVVAMAERSERTEQEIARMRTPEYREEVRRSIEDEGIDLDAVASLFGIARPETAVAKMTPPKGGTLFERLSNFARVRSHVSEPRRKWEEEDPQRTRKPTE